MMLPRFCANNTAHGCATLRDGGAAIECQHDCTGASKGWGLTLGLRRKGYLPRFDPSQAKIEEMLKARGTPTHTHPLKALLN